MNIVAFSLNPLFANKVNGGGTRNLQKVSVHLGKCGHQIHVFSPRRDDSNAPFQWHTNVTVHPCLRFKQPFPGPYEISYHDMTCNLQILGDALVHADRFYLHDGEWLCPQVYDHVPTIVSLRDNVYPESMLGAFNFCADKLLAISQYSHEIYLATVARFNPLLAPRLLTIPNGIDAKFFSYQPPSSALLQYLNIDPRDRRIILHPHRPEASKGMWQTIDVAEKLVFDKKITNLSVLVPLWFDVNISSEVAMFYRATKENIKARGLEENFHFHSWIPQELIAQYYSLGEITLALGCFVEAFGNVPYESMSCGTPAIVARVATHRSLMPEALIDKVHYDDVDEATERALAILDEHRQPLPEAVEFMRDTFSVDQQLAGYTAAIMEAEIAKKSPYVHPALHEQTAYVLAPWCYWSGEKRLYHDFHGVHTSMPELAEQLASKNSLTKGDLATAGWDPQWVDDWCADGYLVPKFKP